MRDLGFCARRLEAESTKLEAHDERFLRVADLAQAGEFAAAGDVVAELFGEGLYDVRLVGYALFAAFHEGGPAQTRTILEHTGQFLTQNLVPMLESDAGGASPDPRVGYYDRAMTWLFRSIADALEYQQAQKTPDWSSWVESLTHDEVAATLAAVRTVSGLLPSPAFQASGTQVVRILQIARALEGAVRAPAADPSSRKTGAPAAAQAASPAPRPSRSPAPAGRPPTSPPTAAAAEEARAPQPLDATGTVRGSARFLELCARLQAFERLVKRGEFNKAAVVSSDIMHTIEHFDPRVFFPEVFASFGALLSEHIEQIGPRWDAKDSVEWRALEQYYQVDLDSFVGHDP